MTHGVLLPSNARPQARVAFGASVCKPLLGGTPSIPPTGRACIRQKPTFPALFDHPVGT